MSDRRCVYLRYQRRPEGQPRIQNHWCSPGLSASVLNYSRKEYGEEPVERIRSRRLIFDPGGMSIVERSPWLHLDGWRFIVNTAHVSVALYRLEERVKRDPKVYGKKEAFRLSVMSGMILIPPKETMLILAFLRGVASSAAQKTHEKRVQLAQSKHLLITGVPKPPEGLQ